ncbi:thiosulfate oxidation carrier protein SoxY [uncultured Thiohalocapsa sp.]|uniref:thiosulfate oxidation carrier protein SoxY n=1 Tax=uncultured Thiohalocapsa sp. TaxID=768990 RepID=UPI0025E7C3F0|nr:thiosulfate oxidation carrier protein SoxY [uncultured Thiohalocapsa sp.]
MTRAATTNLQPPRRRDRRTFVQAAAGLALAGVGFDRLHANGLTRQTVTTALAAIGAATRTGAVAAPDAVTLTLPDFIEDGASVPVTVTSTLPDIEDIYVLADMNPAPIATHCRLGRGVAPRLSVRIKLAGSGRVYGAVRTAGGLYWTAADAEVTVGGCG